MSLKNTLALALSLQACEREGLGPNPMNAEGPAPVDDTALADASQNSRLSLEACLPTPDGTLNFQTQLVTEGATLPVLIGPQGGCHVAVQIRVEGKGVKNRVAENEMPTIASAITGEGGTDTGWSHAGGLDSPVYPSWTTFGDDVAMAVVTPILMQDDGTPLNLPGCTENFPIGLIQGPVQLQILANEEEVENPAPETVYLQRN